MRRAKLVSSRGFTLVETMMVIVVAALLVGIALPRFREQRRRYQLDTAAHQLAGDLRRAQVEAIKRNQPVTLERINDSTYNVDFIGDRIFEGSVKFSTGLSADSVRLAAFGPPTTGARSFVVIRDGAQKTVTVSAAGLVTVQ
ncbi:MAG TPA: GspH/FimT family pseudopilin [Gemmatimonadales bacterium]|nr:GspH/FimT family pseudopilin [Gemmatimonadales bacterium]